MMVGRSVRMGAESLGTAAYYTASEASRARFRGLVGIVRAGALGMTVILHQDVIKIASLAEK